MCSECCNKVYVEAKGKALQAQYEAFGDFYEVTGSDCYNIMASTPGCIPEGEMPNHMILINAIRIPLGLWYTTLLL